MDQTSQLLLFAAVGTAFAFIGALLLSKRPRASQAPQQQTRKDASCQTPSPAAQRDNDLPVAAGKLFIRVTVAGFLLFMLSNVFDGKPIFGAPKISRHRAQWYFKLRPLASGTESKLPKDTLLAQMIINNGNKMEFVVFLEVAGKENQIHFIKNQAKKEGFFTSPLVSRPGKWDLTFPEFNVNEKTYSGWFIWTEDKSFTFDLEMR